MFMSPSGWAAFCQGDSSLAASGSVAFISWLPVWWLASQLKILQQYCGYSFVSSGFGCSIFGSIWFAGVQFHGIVRFGRGWFGCVAVQFNCGNFSSFLLLSSAAAVMQEEEENFLPQSTKFYRHSFSCYFLLFLLLLTINCSYQLQKHQEKYQKVAQQVG